MPVIIETVTYVRFDDVDKPWLIPPTSLTAVDDEPFLKLNARAVRGMRGVIMDNNASVTRRPKVLATAAVKGIKELMDMRNAKHVVEFTESLDKVHARASLLLEDAAVVSTPSNKRPRISRAAQREFRCHPSAIRITTAAGELEVIRPMQSQDSLKVKFDEHNMFVLIKALRDAGLDLHNDWKKKDPNLPKGVRHQDNKYAVKLNGCGGNTKYKLCNTLDEAVDVQRSQDARGEPTSCESDTDEHDANTDDDDGAGPGDRELAEAELSHDQDDEEVSNEEDDVNTAPNPIIIEPPAVAKPARAPFTFKQWTVGRT